MSGEDSLVSRKQAQWEKERAEEQTPWFPFGRPGCGSPNKKSERRESTSDDTTPKRQVLQKAEVHQNVTIEQPSPPVKPMIPPNFCYVNPLLPYQTPFGIVPPLQGCPPMYMYNFLPQGAVPIPIHMKGEVNKVPICPVTMLQSLQHYPAPAMATSFCGSEPSNQEEIPFSDTTARPDDNSMTTAEHSSGRDVPRYEREEDEFRRFENEQKEKLMKEEEERRKTEEREEELRKSLDKRHEAVLKALEKAQKDAEVLRKAKLYKHVIDGSERKDELEQKLLGVDSQTGEEVFKQISQWEKQKKLDWESLRDRRGSGSKKKETVDVNDNHLPSKVQTGSCSSSFSNDHVLNRTFMVEKENMEGQEQSQEAPLYSHEDTFRRTKSLRLSARTTSSLHSPSVSHTITNPLFTPISTRSRRTRTMQDGPFVTSNCDNVMSVSKAENRQSLIPKILVEDEVKHVPLNAAGELFTRILSRSAFASPTSSTPSSPLSSTVYSKKLAEKGCTRHGEDRLSPDIRRRDEANLSRQSSMASLKGSLCNLRGSVQNLSSPSESPNLNKYRSMNPAYRSFNLKKSSDRQKETLDRLTQLREQLRSKENFYGSRNGSSLSVFRP